MISGYRTEWRSTRSVIKRVVTKSGDRAAGVRFVYHECDYGNELDDTNAYYQLIIKLQFPTKEKLSSYERKGKFTLKGCEWLI